MSELDEARIDAVIARIDRSIAAQLEVIVRAPELEQLEAIWRSVAYVVASIDFREHIQLALVHCREEELRSDLAAGAYSLAAQAAPYRPCTGGGAPCAAVVVSFAFDTSDAELLERAAEVGARHHAPFITNASPRCFGAESYAELEGLRTLPARPEHASWRALREREESRWLALCLPRLSLGAHAGRELFAPASFALACCIAGSFARYRHAANIIGPHSGGAVELTPEARLTDRLELELYLAGFIGLCARLDTGGAAFVAAASVHRSEWPSLPWTFIAARIAHYVEVVHREHLGTARDLRESQAILDAWLRGLVSDADRPPPALRAARPFRAATITLEDRPGHEYRYTLELQPHFHYMGKPFTLGATGAVEKPPSALAAALTAQNDAARAWDLAKRVRSWARSRAGVLGVALVGSYARGDERDERIGLLLAVESMGQLGGDAWLSETGAPVRIDREDGVVSSLRVRYAHGIEVEWSVVERRSLEDAKTIALVRTGMRIVYDPHRVLATLAAR